MSVRSALPLPPAPIAIPATTKVEMIATRANSKRRLNAPLLGTLVGPPDCGRTIPPMAPLTISSIDELRELIGKPIGPSDWVEVTQEDINKFAEVSRDDQWIHVDVERAERESPFGTTGRPRQPDPVADRRPARAADPPGGRGDGDQLRLEQGAFSGAGSRRLEGPRRRPRSRRSRTSARAGTRSSRSSCRARGRREARLRRRVGRPGAGAQVRVRCGRRSSPSAGGGGARPLRDHQGDPALRRPDLVHGGDQHRRLVPARAVGRRRAGSRATSARRSGSASSAASRRSRRSPCRSCSRSTAAARGPPSPICLSR